jgi:hypothetical protein
MRPSELKTKLQEAITLAQAGQRTEARRLLDEIVEADPTQELAWMWLASVSTDRDERIQFLERALALDPNNPTTQQAYTQLTGQPYESPRPATESRRPAWSRSLRQDAPISLTNFLIIMAVAAVAVVVIIVALDQRKGNADQNAGAVVTPQLILPTSTPTATWRYSPTPTRTPPPTRTPGPSPTSIWNAPPPTWTSVPSRTVPPTLTPLPSMTPFPTSTAMPTLAPASGTVTPILSGASPTPTLTPGPATLTAEFALTSDHGNTATPTPSLGP